MALPLQTTNWPVAIPISGAAFFIQKSQMPDKFITVKGVAKCL